MQKLYIITRSDLEDELPPGGVASQLIHAAHQFTMDHPTITNYWHLKSNNIVLLKVPNEAALKHLASVAEDRGYAHSVFREIDRGNEATAMALEPDGYKIVSNLPLALKKPRVETTPMLEAV